MPPRSPEAMAALRAMPRLRLLPLAKTRLVRCATSDIAKRLCSVLEAVGRYSTSLSSLFRDKTYLFTNAPDDLLLILAGGGRAVVTASILKKRETH